MFFNTINTLGTFLLLFSSFFLTWLLVYNKIKDWRSSFICAFLYFSVFLYFLSETLSCFHILSSTGILLGWLGYNFILLTFFIYLYKKNRIQVKLPQIFPFQWEYIAFATILLITFFIAVAYPPNNWDSMTYHMPRIEHWLQNGTLQHYNTSDERQLFSAPFAEIFIMQGRALSGNDYLANLVQWFSLLGSITGISKITSHLGMNRKMQITAALFFATLPMAILQASSTQNDLIEAFFIICMAERFLAWQKTGTLSVGIDFGLTLGLSILTKGTAYPVALPFVVCFAFISVKHFRKRFAVAVLAAVICLAVNFPHYVRNYKMFNNPIEAASGTVSNFTLKSFFINGVFNVYANIDIFPLSWLCSSDKMAKLEEGLDNTWAFLKVDHTIFPFGPPRLPDIRNNIFHEDDVRNPFHIILMMVAFIWILSNRKGNTYTLLVIGSWFIFFYFIPWQPWINRLQLPLFALSAPIIPLAFENKDKLRFFSVVLLVCLSILPLTLNKTRPLLSNVATNPKTIWNSCRYDLMFLNGFSSYTDAYAAVVHSKPQNIGLIFDTNIWEYPLWVYIRDKSDNHIRITHVKEDAIDKDIDVLLLIKQQAPDFVNDMIGKEYVCCNEPLVLIRDEQNKSTWKVLYQTVCK